MTIRGRKQLGLIVDPGAARGILGVDTLLEIKQSLLEPRKLAQYLQWNQSFAKFSGISPTQENSLGICSIPCGLQGIPWTVFHADVIGGEASMCPGLIPLHSLMKNAEFMHFAFFQNGDGVLGVRHQGRIEPQRLCLTDSGHYLIRIDMFNAPSDMHLNKSIADRMYYHLMATGRSQPGQYHQYGPRGGNVPSVVLPVFCVEDSSHPNFSDFQ